MAEQWTKWEPIQGLANNYYIDSVSDTIDGFIIQLSDADDEEKKVLVLFEDSVDAYRSADESFRRSTMFDLSQKYDKTFFHYWTFFKVTNSSYIQWLSEQSFGITDSLHFTHFSFIAADSILDVITNYEPKVICIRKNKITNLWNTIKKSIIRNKS